MNNLIKYEGTIAIPEEYTSFLAELYLDIYNEIQEILSQPLPRSSDPILETEDLVAPIFERLIRKYKSVLDTKEMQKIDSIQSVQENHTLEIIQRIFAAILKEALENLKLRLFEFEEDRSEIMRLISFTSKLLFATVNKAYADAIVNELGVGYQPTTELDSLKLTQDEYRRPISEIQSIAS